MGIFSSVVERDGFISLALCSRNKKARPGRSDPRTRSRPRILHFSIPRFVPRRQCSLGLFALDVTGLDWREKFLAARRSHKRVKVLIEES